MQDHRQVGRQVGVRARVELIALVEMLDQLGARFSAVLLIAVVDGAAVTALCEGRAVRDLAVDCVTELLGGA